MSEAPNHPASFSQIQQGLEKQAKKKKEQLKILLRAFCFHFYIRQTHSQAKGCLAQMPSLNYFTCSKVDDARQCRRAFTAAIQLEKSHWRIKATSSWEIQVPTGHKRCVLSMEHTHSPSSSSWTPLSLMSIPGGEDGRSYPNEKLRAVPTACQWEQLTHLQGKSSPT